MQSLSGDIESLVAASELYSVAVGVYDYETGSEFSREGDRPFHAASTIKLAILLAVLKAAASGTLRLDDYLHVRNRFISMADGSVYRVDAAHDGDSDLHKQIGRSRKISDLTRRMITRSSNLATNLLVDYLGADAVRRTLADAGVVGIDFRRGVEDERAFKSDINNRVTAAGLVRLLRLFCEDGFLTAASRELALDILLSQEFRSLIPAGLPDNARVANKTGEISTACHDAAVIFLPERKPYVMVVLTEFRGENTRAKKLIAQVSEAVYKHIGVVTQH
jgi:beta-lactamase class A